MSSVFQQLFTRSTSQEQYYERLKLLFLSIAFFCVIGAYTIAKELKNSVFAHTVGDGYIPLVRPCAMFALIPVLFIYSMLVDRVHRYQLLCIYSGVFGLLGLVFAYMIGHPTIGISNTHESPYRLFGWIFYFFVEGYSPFVVSVFWAFANSINNPNEAKNNYGLMVSASKLGGMFTAGLAWLFVVSRTCEGQPLCSATLTHQVLLTGSSVLLLIVPVVIWIMHKKVPSKYLHGYEAVYQVEKHKQAEGTSKTGIFAGLFMLLKYPYVLGIFGMSFFYEVISVVISYLSVTIAKSQATSASDTLAVLLKIIFMVHTFGFFISFFGTRLLFQKLGTRRCLILIPLSAGLILTYFIFNATSNANALVVASVTLQAINYAFSWPLRESLYIPTVKEIKFKSKSWIDAFGNKFAKTSGSTFNLLARFIGPAAYLTTYSFFFSIVVGLWMVTAVLLGRRFDKAISHKEVIGVEGE